ncbi:hypothetical protein [Arthrobacter sp. PAMC25284]|uniref:hypothetical protein n=1 Tax=Arthrobacter sp. PAMC25284 TaxID=2861279 RepID=UPI002159AA76|nr:hypothetical protein [Arthrobacter sp. PAMC25284]
MTNPNVGRRGSLLASAAVGLLLLAGCSAGNTETSDGGSGAQSASPPSQSPGAAAPSATAAGTSPAKADEQLPAVLPESDPVSLAIPAIGVQTELLSLGPAGQQITGGTTGRSRSAGQLV